MLKLSGSKKRMFCLHLSAQWAFYMDINIYVCMVLERKSDCCILKGDFFALQNHLTAFHHLDWMGLLLCPTRESVCTIGM